MSEGYRPSGRKAADLAADVEAAVAAGRAPAGTILPPVRVLASELGIAPGTVAAAYRLLTDRGVVEGHRRAGTRVRARPQPAWRPVPPPPPGTRDLASGNPDPALLPEIRLTGATPRLYRGPAVLPELARLGRAGFVSDGIDLPALTVTSGALDAVERALTAHVRPGMRVAVEDPGYAGLLDLVAALGLVIEPVGLDAEGMRPDDLAGALERGAQAVILTPRAQNPTGAALTPSRAAALVALLEGRADVLVVEDDHAGGVAGARVRLGGRERRVPRAVIARSCSKGLGPDLRLALVAGDDGTIGAIEGRQAVGPGWVSHLLQGAVAGLLADPADHRPPRDGGSHLRRTAGSAGERPGRAGRRGVGPVRPQRLDPGPRGGCRRRRDGGAGVGIVAPAPGSGWRARPACG